MIKQNIIITLIFTILGAIVFGGYAKHKKTTTYTSSTNLVIGHNLDRSNYKNSTSLSDINMMHTYRAQVNDPMVMGRVYKTLPSKMKKNYSENSLSDAVNAKVEDNSIVMTLSAKTKDAKQSVEIANSTARAFKHEFKYMNPTKVEVKQLSPAKLSNVTSKTSPSLKKYVVLGAALGILVGMLIAFGITSYQKMTK